MFASGTSRIREHRHVGVFPGNGERIADQMPEKQLLFIGRSLFPNAYMQYVSLFSLVHRGWMVHNYLFTSVSLCVWMTGKKYAGVVIFGWPNIQPVLVKKGVFLDRCDPDDLDDDNSCEDQVKMLSLIFTVASATAYGFTLINGMSCLLFGLRACLVFRSPNLVVCSRHRSRAG